MLKIKIVLLFLFAVLHSYYALAQAHEENTHASTLVLNKEVIEKDSLNHLLHSRGVFEGHIRTFFMGTKNYDFLPDYYALGIGGGLSYYSPIIKNFQVGMSGFIIYNVASSNLTPDSLLSNRYEIGLFDIQDPDNHEDLDRLEDLFIRYYIGKDNHSFIQLGKFHLKTPLVNLQDGRMRPNLQEGIWSEWRGSEKISLKSGWIWRTSPRSTVKWFSIKESIGVYSSGRAVNGLPADYAGHVKANGIAIFNINSKHINNTELGIWNYTVPGLFTTSILKGEKTWSASKSTWFLGVQYITQQALHDETLAIEKQYITENESSHAISTRLSTIDDNSTAWSINFTRITAHGRFLFPREWGVEPFYTYMNRERMEGAGNVHALMLQHDRILDKKKHLMLQTQAGIFDMPDISNARLNKYTMPDFYHVNLRLRYKFTGFLHGMQTDILYTYKGALDSPAEVIPSFYHNKVNTHLVSVVMDYYF